MRKCYAAVGADTKEARPFREDFEVLARHLSKRDWLYRNSGSLGVASWVMDTEPLRWVGFDWRDVRPEAIVVASHYLTPETIAGDTAQKLYGQRVHMVLGPLLTHEVSFVLSYTDKCSDNRFDSFAVRVAQAHGIPTYNFATGCKIEDVLKNHG